MDPICVLADLADVAAAVRVAVATQDITLAEAYRLLDDAIAMLTGPVVSSRN